MAYAPGTNTGHGHVWERPDGIKARCGGPNICRECSADMPPINFASLVNPEVIKQLDVAKDKRIAELEAVCRNVVDKFGEAFDQPDPSKTLGAWREEMLDALKACRAVLQKSTV